MQPAFSVIFLTTLIGVGQGLFLALFTGQSYSAVELLPIQDSTKFYGNGAIIALVFLIGGLVASFLRDLLVYPAIHLVWKQRELPGPTVPEPA